MFAVQHCMVIDLKLVKSYLYDPKSGHILTQLYLGVISVILSSTVIYKLYEDTV